VSRNVFTELPDCVRTIGTIASCCVSIADGEILYAADSLRGRILAVNLTDLSVDVIYETADDVQLHAIAVGEKNLYFSAWNRKYDATHS